MAELEIRISGSDVIVEGDIDTHTAPMLLEQLEQFDGSTNLSLDLSATRFISSAGLSVILDIQRRLDSAGGSLRLTDVDQNVARTIELSGLSERFGLR